MELKEFLKTLSDNEKVKFADACGTTVNYLKLVAYKAKTPSADLSINFERESGGVVQCEISRPDTDWKYIRGTSKQVDVA